MEIKSNPKRQEAEQMKAHPKYPMPSTKVSAAKQKRQLRAWLDGAVADVGLEATPEEQREGVLALSEGSQYELLLSSKSVGALMGLVASAADRVASFSDSVVVERVDGSLVGLTDVEPAKDWLTWEEYVHWSKVFAERDKSEAESRRADQRKRFALWRRVQRFQQQRMYAPGSAARARLDAMCSQVRRPE